TDGFMSDTQLKDAMGGVLLHIPTVMGAVVPTYNIPEIPSTGKALNFSAETLSGIFLGTITKWNDPKIAADNPGVTLPTKDIVSVHRADGSGTTYIFTDYLSSVSADWKSKVGNGNSVNWPSGLGAPGNAGVAGEVKNTPYSIGYVELIYAIQQKLGYGNVKNKAGKYVTANLQAVSDAAANSKAAPADLRASIVNADGDTSYPISGFTWQLVYTKLTDKAKATALTRLLWWETHDGQKFASDLGYAPLPDPIIKMAEDSIKSITVDGTKALPY
ncbi:MAG: phosphate ABC transporter substrate-binding protein PstS, partial [Dehalococcoidia bacterium]|nr:phosphate ABC transporter substrate-binding protein PstS [Dehalococcoidia bacterium]